LATACADGVVAAMMLKQYYRDPEGWADEKVDGGSGW